MKINNNKKIILIGLIYSIILTILITQKIIFNPGYPLYKDLQYQFDKDMIYKYYYYSWNPVNNYPTGGEMPYSFLYRTLGILPVSMECIVKLIFFTIYLLIPFNSFMFIYYLMRDKERNQIIISAISGSLVYTLNHWVYSSSLGYIFILAGYAVAPLIGILLMKSFKNPLYSIIISLIMFIVLVDPRNIIYISISLLPILFITKAKIKSKIKSLVISLACLIPLISYWLLPGVGTNVQHLPFSHVEFLSTNSNISNSIRLFGFFMITELKYLIDNNVILYLLSFMVPFFCFTTILLKPKDKNILAYTALAIITLLLTQGTYGPLRLIYINLDKIPIIGKLAWIVREPDKLSFVIGFIYAFLFSQFISEFYEFNNKTLKKIKILKKYKNKIICSIFGVILILNLPFFNGDFRLKADTTGLMSHEYPIEYYEINEYLKNDTYSKALWIPFSYGQIVFNWADNLVSSLPKELTSVYQHNLNDLNFKLLMTLYYDIINSNNAENQKGLLNALGIKYIMVYNDFKLDEQADFFNKKEYINTSIFKSFNNKTFGDNYTIFINENANQFKTNINKKLIIGSLKSYSELIKNQIINDQDIIFFDGIDYNTSRTFLNEYNPGDTIIFYNSDIEDLMFSILENYTQSVNKENDNFISYLVKNDVETSVKGYDLSYDGIYRMNELKDYDLIPLFTYEKDYLIINNTKEYFCFDIQLPGDYIILIRNVDGKNYNGFNISLNEIPIVNIKKEFDKDNFKINDLKLNLKEENQCISIDSQNTTTIISDIKVIYTKYYASQKEKLINELSNKTIIYFFDEALNKSILINNETIKINNKTVIKQNIVNTTKEIKVTNFTRINPSEISLKIESNQSFYLTLTDTYDNNWVAFTNLSSYKSVKSNYFMNSFYINETGNLTIKVYHKNQDKIVLGTQITNLTLITLILIIVVYATKKLIHIQKNK